jgi:hypothetical protein
LNQFNGFEGEDNAIFSLSEDMKQFFGEDGTGGYFYRDLINYWRYVAQLNIPLADVIRGAHLPEMPQWPPKTQEAAFHLGDIFIKTGQLNFDCLNV